MKIMYYISGWIVFQMIALMAFSIGNLSTNIRQWNGDAVVGFALMFFTSSLATLILSMYEIFNNKK